MVAGISTGQNALSPLPPRSPSRRRDAESNLLEDSTLENVEIPGQLKKPGIKVFKVGKKGNKSAMTLTLSHDRRTLIFTHKKILFETKQPKYIDISTIDRIQQGRTTKRFDLLKETKEKKLAFNELNNCLSIIYFVKKHPGDENNAVALMNTTQDYWTSLDLIITNHNDYQLLIQFLDNHLVLYSEYRSRTQKSILFLQHIWLDYCGKTFSQRMLPTEFGSICDQLSIPLRRSKCVKLYRQFCKALKMNPDNGISIAQAVELLEHTRNMIVSTHGNDPLKMLWNKVSSYESNTDDDEMFSPLIRSDSLFSRTMAVKCSFTSDMDCSGDDDESDRDSVCSEGYEVEAELQIKVAANVDSEGEPMISAYQFLKFLHFDQKDTDARISYVQLLFERLNGQTSACSLGENGFSQTMQAKLQSSSKDFITQSTFLSFLMSDGNDLFDPSAAKYNIETLTEPLSSYFINTSHDTFLLTNPLDIGFDSKADVNHHAQVSTQLFTVALTRGCRCIELDVWDGVQEQLKTPVVMFGSEKNRHEVSRGIPFSYVVQSVYNFLRTNNQSTPIILSMENHCRDIENEKEMASTLSSILGSNDMLYVPVLTAAMKEESALPSPKELLGKVVIRCKRPMKIDVGSEVIYNDYDEVLDYDYSKMNHGDEWKELDHQEEDEYSIRRVIANFEANIMGQLFSHTTRSASSPTDILDMANKNAKEAKDKAVLAEKKAFMANLHVIRAGDIAMRLMKKANVTISDVEEIISNPTVVKLPLPDNAKTDRSISKNTIEDDDEDEDEDEDEETYADSKEDNYNDENLVEELVQATKSYDKDRYDSTMSKWIKKSSVKAEELVTRAMARLGIVDSDSSDEYDSSAYSSFETTTIDTNTQMEDIRRPIFNCANADDFAPYNFVCGSSKVFQNFSAEASYNHKDDDILGDPTQKDFDELKMRFILADDKANQSSAALIHAKANVNKAVLKLRSAEDSLVRAEKRKSDAADSFNRKSKEMSACKEHAEVSQRLVVELSDLLNEAEVQVIQAENECERAEEESLYWDKRARKAEELAKSAKEKWLSEQKEADSESSKLIKLEPSVNVLKEKALAMTTKALAAKQCLGHTISLLQNTDSQIQRIVSSNKFRDEHRPSTPEKFRNTILDDLGNAHTQKYQSKVQDRDELSRLAMKQETEYTEAENARVKIQKEYDDAMSAKLDATKRREAANDRANKLFVETQHISTISATERQNADVRSMAMNKAKSTLEKFVGLKSVVVERLTAAKEAAKEANETLLAITHKLECSMREKVEKSDLEKYHQRVKRLSTKLDEAIKRMEEASETKDACEASVNRARSELDKRAAIIYKGKLEAITSGHKNSAKRQLEKNAVSLYKRYIFLQEVAEQSLLEADAAKRHAADQVAIAKQAEEYKEKKALMRPIHPDLARITTLHSTLFGYVEKSLSYPSDYMHSLSEAQLFRLMKEPGFDVSLWQEFSTNHIFRTFPSRQESLRKNSKNMNPLIPWSLGCQIAAINTQVFDAFVLVNDGRFRQNGSCGYVLKPPHLANLKNQLYSSVNDHEQVDAQEWEINILCAQNIPKISKKAGGERTNPRVRLTVYDGGSLVPQAYATKVIKRNGFNPIWIDNEESFRFSVNDSSVAIVLFSVWDCDQKTGKEDFLGAAAVPVSCMRQGYRSVALFDANHMRGGDIAYASLFLKATRKSSGEI